MAKVKVSRIVDASMETVWNSWDDFGNIYKFNPNLKFSKIIGGTPDRGLGSERQCDLKDGKNWVTEKIVGYEHHKNMVIEITGGSMPLKSGIASTRFRSLGQNKTEVSLEMEFVAKGFFGFLLTPLMKPTFKFLLNRALKANEEYVTHGKLAATA